MSLLAKEVPEDGREFVGPVFDTDFLGALHERGFRITLGRDAGQVALDIGGEDRNASVREPLGEHLQGDRLARTGCSGDQAMTVCEA